MCTRPISLRVDNAQGLRTIQVPCGKCFECLRTYQSDWTVRLFEESLNWSKMTFFTLTYNEHSIPTVVDKNTGECWHSVCKCHVQKWLKRYRTSQDRQDDHKDFKYFITSEYGPRTLRPHYHGIVFGLSPIEFWGALKDWEDNFGYMSYSAINMADSSSRVKSCEYVAKYCSKGQFENPYALGGIVDKTFHLMSKGLGKSYIDKMKSFHLGTKLFKGHDRISSHRFTDKYLDYVTTHRKVLLPGKEVAVHMPRYYSEKIYGTKNSLSAQIADFLCKKYGEIRDRAAGQLQAEHPGWSFGKAFSAVILQEASAAFERESMARSSLARCYDFAL